MQNTEEMFGRGLAGEGAVGRWRGESTVSNTERRENERRSEMKSGGRYSRIARVFTEERGEKKNVPITHFSVF